MEILMIKDVGLVATVTETLTLREQMFVDAVATDSASWDARKTAR
jgi:hypothetical protein